MTMPSGTMRITRADSADLEDHSFRGKRRDRLGRGVCEHPASRPWITALPLRRTPPTPSCSGEPGSPATGGCTGPGPVRCWGSCTTSWPSRRGSTTGGLTRETSPIRDWPGGSRAPPPRKPRLALLERFGSPAQIRKAGRRRLVTVLRPKAPRMAERLVEDIFTAGRTRAPCGGAGRSRWIAGTVGVLVSLRVQMVGEND